MSDDDLGEILHCLEDFDNLDGLNDELTPKEISRAERIWDRYEQGRRISKKDRELMDRYCTQEYYSLMAEMEAHPDPIDFE